MDRIDKIVKASKEKIALSGSFITEPIKNMIEDYRRAFTLGALWADEHPYVENVIHDDSIMDLNLSEDD